MPAMWQMGGNEDATVPRGTVDTGSGTTLGALTVPRGTPYSVFQTHRLLAASDSRRHWQPLGSPLQDGNAKHSVLVPYICG